MTYVYLVFLLACAARLIVGKEDQGSLAKLGRCHFTVEGQEFNLCPIFAAREGQHWIVENEVQTPPTVTKTQYRFSLDGPLAKDGTLPAHEQCPDGTWICMTMTNVRPHHESEPPRTLQVIPVSGSLQLDNVDNYTPGLNLTASLADSREKSHHKVLQVRLHGGYYVNKPQFANFYFFCNHYAEEPSTPSYYYSWFGHHALKWQTKHACPIGSQATSTVEAGPPPTGLPPQSPVDEEEPPPLSEDEKDLIGIPPPTNRPLRSSGVILLSSTTVVLILVYLTYYPPRFLRRVVSSYLKSRPSLLRFRVGERVLVRWAQEDLELQDEGEEDYMINGGSGRDAESIFVVDGDDDEEAIPLKPSPKKIKTKGHSSYGSMS